jgi:protein SCO1/2
MKFKKHNLARGAVFLSTASMLASLPASAQPNRGLAPNIDTGAVASAKGSMASPQDVTLSKVRWDQKQGNELPMDATFKDENGQSVQLKKYFKGDKPVVLMMIFFNCTMLCSEVMNGSLELFKDKQKDLGFKIGRDYEVVTISIDPKEGPDIAIGKKKAYLSQLKDMPQAAQGWHLLTGQDEQIKTVADAIGYRYTYDSSIEQYAHPGGIVTVTPEGKVSRYFPGVSFDGKDVRLGLIEASRNKIGTAVEKLALFTCFHYNPTTGKYSLALMKLVQLAAIATILGIGTGIWVMRGVERKAERKRDEKSKIGSDKTAALGT